MAEFRSEDPNVPILPLHKMSKKQILKEFTANRFRLAEQFDGLPWQHLMFFRRDDAGADRLLNEVSVRKGKMEKGERAKE